MNTSVRFTLRALLAWTFAFALASCQSPSAPTQNAQDNNVQDIRVQMVEPIRTTAKVEQFPLPNCGGTDRLAQSLGTYASANKSSTVSGRGTITGGGEVGIPETTKLKLEIQVELAYQNTFEAANSRLDSIEMAAAAGTHVVYTIIWEEQTFESLVRYSLDNQVYEVPYVYKLSVPKIDTSYNVTCGSSNVEENTGGSQNSNDGSAIQPPATVTGTQFCPPIGSSDAVFEGDVTVFGDRISASVGTGVFTSVIRPFGTKPSQYTYVRDALNQLCVQTISPGSLADRASDRQCATSNYTTNRLWVGTVLAGTSISVRKSSSVEFMEIGRIDIPVSDTRSYVIEYDLAVGDEICMVAPIGKTMGEMLDRGGYHMFWGRDLRVFTDSWCMLLENDDTRHYCN